MGAVYETIRQRRTVRRFKDKSIPEETLIKLVDAARLAPSAENIQPCEYIIVNDSQLKEEVFSCLKWAGYIRPEGNPPEGEKPASYIIVLINAVLRKKGGEADAAAGIENILLTAWEEGIGGCWLGSINRKKIKKILRIPHHLRVNSVVALGYINEHPVAEELKNSVEYWKDEKGVLHVPKRKLTEIVHKNKYGNCIKL